MRLRFPKSQTELQKQVNAALQEMQDNGTLQKIDASWFGKDDAAKVLPDMKLDGKNGVIRYATNSSMAPFAYIKHGKIVGYDIEIALMIAAKLGRKLEIIDMDVAAIIPSLVSGKSDMAGCGITVTKERARSVLFSIPNYSGGIVVMVAAGSAARRRSSKDGIWSGLVKSFDRTFVVEGQLTLLIVASPPREGLPSQHVSPLFGPTLPTHRVTGLLHSLRCLGLVLR